MYRMSRVCRVNFAATTRVPGSIIQQQALTWLQHTVAACLVLACASYFIVKGGSANSLPTYLLAICALIFLAWRPGSIAFYDWQLLALVSLLLFYLGTSVAWSHSGESVFKHLGFALLIVTFCLAVPLSLERYPWFLYWLVLIVILAAVINSAYSIYLHYAYDDYQPLPEPRLYAMGRLSNPVIGALSFGLAAVLSFFMVLTRERRVAKIVFAEAILLFVGAIVLTGSRGVWPALLVAAITGILLHYPGNRKLQLLGVAGTIFFATAVVFVLLGPELLLKRALSHRPEIWAEFLSRTIASHPWFGAGLTADSTFQIPGELIKHPHSMFIATFYYGGLVGLGLLLAVIARAISTLLAFPNSHVKTLAGMLLSYGLVANLVDGDAILTKINYLWLVFWLPIGLILLKDSRRLA